MTVKVFKVLPMSTIRLTKTKEMERVLNEIRKFLPLLEDSEIIKIALSSYYFDLTNMPTRMATPEEEEAILEGRKDIENGHYKVIPADQPIDLDKLLNDE